MNQHGWFKENIIPLIAVMYTAFSFTVKFIIILGYSHTSETLASTIESNDNNLLIFIFGYYFGSAVQASKPKPAVNVENIEKGIINENDK